MAFFRKKIKLILFVLAFVVVAPIVVLYAMGDTLGTGWNLLPTGGIYVNGAPAGSSVYLNGAPAGTTSFFERNIFLKNLRPGIYDVAVSKQGYNTWFGEIIVTNNIVADADVFVLPTTVPLDSVGEYASSSASSSVRVKNPAYAAVAALFATSAAASTSVPALGTKASPIMAGDIGIWNEGNVIFARWLGDTDEAPPFICATAACTGDLPVTSLPAVPRRTAFLPGADDAIVIAIGTNIFAVSIENNPRKLPQLIYRGAPGSAPDFRVAGGSLYIKDGAALFQAEL